MNLFEMMNYPEQKYIDKILCLNCYSIQVLLFLIVILNKRVITKPELVNYFFNISSSVVEAIYNYRVLYNGSPFQPSVYL